MSPLLPSTSPPDRLATGIVGFDDVIGGGFPRNHLYLVDGDPGTGKTTLGLSFLLEGARRGEAGLYVTLSETAQELNGIAASHGWSLDRIAIHELTDETGVSQDAQYTVFQPAEVELADTMRTVFDTVHRVDPLRVVIDSLSEMRLLARDPLRYRRQILMLKQFFSGRHSTVLLLDDRTVETGDRQLHSLAHGVVRLDQLAREYGPSRRRLQIIKLRGSAYREGFHDFVIRRGGLDVYPRLIAAEHERAFQPEAIPSGVAGIDALVGGGLTTGSTVLLMGPAGVGKSLVTAQLAAASARRGQRAAVFVFDEERQTLLDAAAGIGIDLAGDVARGQVTVQVSNPAELSPGEFTHRIRRAVEVDRVGVVAIDSLNGYMNAMPEESLLDAHLRELFSYLRQSGVLTLVTLAQHGVVGQMRTTVDISYLADVVLLFRFYEARATVHRALSVVKRRGGPHEATIRELTISSSGLHVGPPLVGFEGLLTGVPRHVAGAGGDGA